MRKIHHRPRRRLSPKLVQWNNKLAGFPAFILGTGCSIDSVDLHLLDNYFTIGINRIYSSRLTSDIFYDPTILLWQDGTLNREDVYILEKLQAIKYCRDVIDSKRLYNNFNLKPGPYKFTKQTNVLYGSGSSGPLAVELAVGLGCNNIILLGMDCKKAEDGRTDFYGINKHWNAGTLPHCLAGLKAIKELCPVPVYSCSSNDLFECNSLEEIIARIDPKGVFAIGRERFKERMASQEERTTFLNVPV